MLLYTFCLLYHTLTGIHRIIDRRMRPLLSQRADFKGMFTVCMPFWIIFTFFPSKKNPHKIKFANILSGFIYNFKHPQMFWFFLTITHSSRNNEQSLNC